MLVIGQLCIFNVFSSLSIEEMWKTIILFFSFVYKLKFLKENKSRDAQFVSI